MTTGQPNTDLSSLGLMGRMLKASLASAAGDQAVAAAMQRNRQALCIAGQNDRLIDLNQVGRVYVLAIGKAAAAMARPVEALFADWLDAKRLDGLIVTKHGHDEAGHRLPIMTSGHPLPDQAGSQAAIAIEKLLTHTTPQDLVLVLISGGASALLPAPLPGLNLDDLIAVTDHLLAAGADIDAINCIRRHCDRLKGGGLLRQAAPARVITLALSDVIGNDPAAIGSGPSAADDSNFAQALALAEAFAVPAKVKAALQAGVDGRHPETVKASDPLWDAKDYHIIAANAHALQAAAQTASDAAYTVEPIPPAYTEDVGQVVQGLSSCIASLKPGAAFLAGGEPTVRLPADHGLGGRNQHLALLLARELAGQAQLQLCCFGTDGTDGPTDAAGALITGQTWQELHQAGIDGARAIARHDAYRAFDRIGALLRTGPTGTNVNDLIVAVRQPGGD